MIKRVIDEMIKYYAGDAKRTLHFIEVHALAAKIGRDEGLDADTLFILETAAAVHDIGIKISEEKYGSSDGKLQEREGEPAARELLTRLNFEPRVIERVCYLVAHHHTYQNIDGLDYQILVEADFLVNIHEDNLSEDAAQAAYQNIFKTESGKRLCRLIYSL